VTANVSSGVPTALSVITLAGLPPELRLRLPDGTSVRVARDLRARLHPTRSSWRPSSRESASRYGHQPIAEARNFSALVKPSCREAHPPERAWVLWLAWSVRTTSGCGLRGQSCSASLERSGHAYRNENAYPPPGKGPG
jgi:hypothetical protein